MPSWCEHPREDLQRIYKPSLTIYSDRLLCGLCGELIFLPDPWARQCRYRLQNRRIVVPDGVHAARHPPHLEEALGRRA
jgi:hypothetical protein